MWADHPAHHLEEANEVGFSRAVGPDEHGGSGYVVDFDVGERPKSFDVEGLDQVHHDPRSLLSIDCPWSNRPSPSFRLRHCSSEWLLFTCARAECEICPPRCDLTKTILALRREIFQLCSVIGEANRRKDLDSPECSEPNRCIPSFGSDGCAAASSPIAEVGPADVFDQRCPLDPKIGIPAREFVPFVNPDSRNMPSGAVCCPCKDGFQPARHGLQTAADQGFKTCR